MKRKLLLAVLCAVSALGGQLRAQTDVTSTYMTNPSFEKANAATGDVGSTGVITDDWNITTISYARCAIFNSGSTVSTYGGTTSASNGSYYLMIRSNLDQGKTQNIKQNSDMSLPKGKYSISFDYKAARVKDVNRNLKVSAINSSSSELGKSTIAIPKVAANSSYIGGINWSTSSFEFTLEETTATRINISCETQGTANSSSSQHTVVLLDNFVINYSNINVEKLEQLIAQATTINNKLSTLTSEIATAQVVYDGINDTPDYQDDIDEAISTLQTAIDTKVADYTFNPAGDDISALYIWNNGFDIDINFSSSSSTATTANTVYPTFGWTPTVPGNCTGATMGYGYSGSINGGNASAPAKNADGTADGGALIICVGWSGQVIYKSLAKTFPAGSYRITYRAYNGNTKNTSAVEAIPLVGFVPTEGDAIINSTTETFTNQDWSTHTYDFELASPTEGKIQIGLKPIEDTNSYNAPELFIDEVKLTYFNPLTLAQIQWQEAWDALDALDETLLPNAAETAINDALSAAEPTTVKGYNTATAALQALIDSYDGIKAAFDEYKALKALVEDLKNTSKYTFTGDDALSTFNSTLSTIDGSAENATDAATLTELLPSLKTAGNTFVGAIDSNDGFDLTYNIENNSFETGALSPWTTSGKNDTGVKLNSNATYTTTGVDGSYLFNTWDNGNGSKVSQTLSSLPNGYYTVTALVASDAGNKIDILAGATTKTVDADGTSGKNLFVEGTTDKTLVSEGSLEIGTNSSKWYKSDYFRLTYYTVKAGAAEAWAAAKAAAEAARDNAEYTYVTGSEKTNLLTEIAKAEPTTAEAYGTATTALQEATSAFTAAKDSYDGLIAKRSEASAYTTEAWPYASSSKKTAIDDAVSATPTNAEDAVTKTNAITTAIRLFVESNGVAEGVANAVDYTSYITNANCDNISGWTITGTGGNVEVKNADDSKYTQGDGSTSGKYIDGGWASNTPCDRSASQSFTLPAGEYQIQITARSSVETYTMSVTGKDGTGADLNASVNLPTDDDKNGTFGRGWSDKRLVFTTDGSELTLTIHGEASNNQTWMSFDRIRLMKIDATLATAEDYKNLNDAIDEAEAKQIGFDEGEYAPYNNVGIFSLLAAAKAIDQEANNTQEDVQAATTALSDFSWAVNETEVNAFYDGNFAIQPEHTTSPTALTGWNNPEGIRQLIKNTETNQGLNSATEKAAVFAWGNTTMFYGETEGYTLPLNAQTIYELSFKTCGWRDGDMGYVNVDIKNSSNEGLQTVSSATATKRITEENPWVEFRILFVTGEAGNYKFGMWTSKHTTFTDLSLVKASSQVLTLNNATPKYAAGTYPAVALDRKFNTANYSTLCLPFAMDETATAAAFAEVYEFNRLEGESLKFISADDIEAGTPYLVKAKSASLPEVEDVALNPATTVSDVAKEYGNTTVTFKGTFAPIDAVAEGSYIVSNNKLYYVDSAVSLAAYRAYFRVETSETEVKNFVLDFGDLATGINTIDNGQQQTANSHIYNLAGQRLNKAQKGVNIINGKKVLVK